MASLVWAVAGRRPVATAVPSASARVSAALAGPRAPRALTRPGARTDRPQSRPRVRLEVPPLGAAAAEGAGDASDSRVLVPDDQRIALVSLLQRLHQGRATVPVSLVPAYDKDGLLVPPERIVIAPLPSLAPPDPDDLGDGTVNPRKPGRDK
jgi:hypothetical protein